MRQYKHILFTLLMVLCCMNTAYSTAETLLILNSENIPGQLPKHFRSSKDHFQYLKTDIPTREGLEGLNISGSSQFSYDGLAAIFKKVGSPKKFYVVDLRQESHGFINGVAVSWYTDHDWINKGKTPKQVIKDENSLLNAIKNLTEVAVYKPVEKNSDGIISKTQEVILQVQSVSNEENFVRSQDYSYLRLFVTDHLAPSNEEVDQFITFVKQLPPDAWVHFHCKAGDGRTTTFMAMFDMLHNANKVSFDDIILRQWLVGGINLSKKRDPNNWKYTILLERTEFLKKFYEYAQKNSGTNFSTSWSDYKKIYLK